MQRAGTSAARFAFALRPPTRSPLRSITRSQPPAGSPDKDRWNGPYLEEPAPMDPWGRRYRYMAPSKHRPRAFDLWSAGPDGVDGTEDDIGVGGVNK